MVSARSLANGGLSTLKRSSLIRLGCWDDDDEMYASSSEWETRECFVYKIFNRLKKLKIFNVLYKVFAKANEDGVVLWKNLCSFHLVEREWVKEFTLFFITKWK